MLCRACALALALLLTTGCQTQGAGSWRTALAQSAREPSVWLPLAAAATVAVADRDDEWSEDAIADRPVFGDQAQDRSDKLRDLSTVTALGTALLAPAPDWSGRIERLGLNLSVMLAEGVATTVLKDLTERERPDRMGDRSFPSGHAAQAASRYSLTAHNLNEFDLDPRLQLGLSAGVVGLTTATAWARVEAAKHYPSDVLVGIALGNLFANFAYRWWYPARGPLLSLQPVADGVAVTLRVPLSP
ncbi:MAG: phosphatase PAP2 family protein [Pseudomonadota bacterium]